MINKPESTRVRIGPVWIDQVTLDGAVERVFYDLRQPRSKPMTIMASNAQFINLAASEPKFTTVANDATLNVADGISLVYASRVLGKPLPERVVGLDLMCAICARGAVDHLRVFLLGGREGAAEEAGRHLTRMYPGVNVVGTCRPPMGREFHPEVAHAIQEQIIEARPDFLVVCFGAPRQEYWIAQFALDLPVKIIMGNGAAFDYLAGHLRRAPQFIQNAGCEWLYRLCIEPRRLWRRYLVGNASFFRVVWQTRRTDPALASR
jgi:N-acetylglucosaminyldiphosphoundecaprenol N-acetyl-beta-D-mannosaminyltransferase